MQFGRLRQHFFSSGALHPGLYDFLKKKMSIYPGWPCSRKRSTQKCSASSRNLGDYAGMSASLCWVRIILLVLNVLPTCSLFAGTWSQLVWNFTWRTGLMRVCKLAWIDAVACLILHWTFCCSLGHKSWKECSCLYNQTGEVILITGRWLISQSLGC